MVTDHREMRRWHRMRFATTCINVRLIKQSLKVGVSYQGQIEPTTVGVPQGAPISPLYSNIYLNLLDQVWHKRGYPEKLGASLHRYADDAILVCRKSAAQAIEAFEAIAS